MEYLIYQNIFNDPTVNAIMSGRARIEDFSYIMPQKSLFNNPKYIGLPIGNLTSQFYSNVYLNELDQFCKHTLKIHYYVRYVDDIVIFDHNPDIINYNIDCINQFLQQYLQLSLHPNKIHVGLISDGVSFIGKVIRPFNFNVSNRIIANINLVINNFRVDSSNLKYIPIFQSYLGLLSHSKTFYLKKYICQIVHNACGIEYDRNTFSKFYI